LSSLEPLSWLYRVYARGVGVNTCGTYDRSYAGQSNHLSKIYSPFVSEIMCQSWKAPHYLTNEAKLLGEDVRNPNDQDKVVYSFYRDLCKHYDTTPNGDGGQQEIFYIATQYMFMCHRA